MRVYFWPFFEFALNFGVCFAFVESIANKQRPSRVIIFWFFFTFVACNDNTTLNDALRQPLSSIPNARPNDQKYQNNINKTDLYSEVA